MHGSPLTEAENEILLAILGRIVRMQIDALTDLRDCAIDRHTKYYCSSVLATSQQLLQTVDPLLAKLTEKPDGTNTGKNPSL